MGRLAIIWVVFVAAFCAVAGANETRVVVRDQCPGKFCTFGPWVLEEETRLVEAPMVGSAPVAVLPAGEAVTIVTGEVHAIPGEFRVHRAHGRYRAGDRLRVVSYIGGGEWMIEFAGSRYAENLGFSPWGGVPGRRCEVREQCWGTLQEPFDWHFWAQIEKQDGTVGWSKRWGTQDSGTPFEVPE